MRRAVFLDRDGVLVTDVDFVTGPEQLMVLPGAAEALARLRAAGFFLAMVSNQAVVARGLATESQVDAINRRLNEMLRIGPSPPLDASYFCPHHPNANLPAYRVVCDCRKPAPGMFHRAARDHHLDLAASFLIGDRLSDILAGARAGCRTALVQTGKHDAPPIETPEPMETSIRPDFIGQDLPAAVAWILSAL